jgi:cytochrome c oxidase cbb3-type subunit 3
MEYFIDSGEKPAIIEYPITQFFMLLVLMILIAIELILSSIENIMFQTLSEEGKEKYLAAKNKKYEWTWAKNVMSRLTRSRSIEREGEIILDHNYDGIRELDNVLPPWWVYLFYGTIIFAVVYLVRFHIIGDYDQKLEYEQEVAAAQQAIEEYKKTAKDLVDVNTVEFLSDESDLSAGEKIFQSNCVACHMADGGGGIGPNLTDEYWILGGGIKNVFHTISEGGRDGKGMIAWKQSLKPAEIAQVASYVLTLGGTTPANPKEPQGDIWVDPDAPQQPEGTESETPPTEQVSDSTTVAMN